jgi:superfamily II DNA or RNA helicase
MPLAFHPDLGALFLWGDDVTPQRLPELVAFAPTTETTVVGPGGNASTVTGFVLALPAAVEKLAVVPASELASLSASVQVWALASKLSLELVSRERVLPALLSRSGGLEARWAAALTAPEDAARLTAMARLMPPSAHAVPPAPGNQGRHVWASEALLRAFLDAAVDALVRAARGGPALNATAPARSPARWEQRLAQALTDASASFEARGFGERTVADDVARWSEPALGRGDRLRACLRLELPAEGEDVFALTLHLQSPDDPSLLVSAAEVWKTTGRQLALLGRAFRDPQESLLEALGRAARVFPPLARCLEHSHPEGIALDATGAWAFLSEGAPALIEAGFSVVLPSELTARGQRRLRLRMRLGGKSSKTAGVVQGASALSLEEVMGFQWEAALGDEPLSARELSLLAQHKAPLVRHRGAWVAVDPRELAEIHARVGAGGGHMATREALHAALAGELREQDGRRVSVAVEGTFAELVERLRQGASRSLEAPRALQATLRPYQARGLSWLDTMASLGLGACLADDMGLGKTIQLLSFMLRQRERASAPVRPALLVAPTSVVGNWEREVQRFAPSLTVVRHYGAERARDVESFPRGALVLTTYGVLRRDAELLSQARWSLVALDEAQNIKNGASATARAARTLHAGSRFALTGTPVENRLAELWSILEFANPGLLGPLEQFRRDYAIPIERYGNDEAAARLKRIVGPLVLRRLKSDPAIISDLPEKNEMRVVCSLTREQASLYRAVVDEEMRRIESAEGIERRGRVLSLLMHLKQVCNHPAQYLSEAGPLARRSGKLARATEMLEEAMAAGDKALVFTQFREMGELLSRHFAEALDVGVQFLHGGTPKKTRDEMVSAFQQDGAGPRVFVLSVKAGGTGLNLTAASHVFHFDRWWNPAVEDQATDRAYRIGQTRAVQVHKLLCAGTVEEKVDLMLEQKRELAARVVGAGERWITELGNADLRELFALSDAAVVASDEGDEPEQRPARPRGAARVEP